MLLLVLIEWFLKIVEKGIVNLLGLSLEFQACSIKTPQACSSGMKGLLHFLVSVLDRIPFYTKIVIEFIAYCLERGQLLNL